MEISILDNIHTRIQSTESVSTLMSAFMVDLRQVNKVIYVKQITLKWSNKKYSFTWFI